MSSQIGSPRPKSKGVRSFLRAIGCGSPSPFSSPPSSPQPQVSVPPVVASESDNQPSSAPLRIGAETDDPQPTTSPADADTITSSKEKTTIGHMAWAGAGIALEMLKEASGVCAPLGLAAQILGKFFETTETAAKNRDDYEDLATELAAIHNMLKPHSGGSAFMSGSMSTCLSRISKGVEQQAREIEKKQRRKKGTQWVLANDDEDDVMNLQMSAWIRDHEDLVNKRLTELGPIREAAYDSKVKDSVHRRSCTKGTRENVLSDLKTWSQDPKSPAVRWMNGMAGTGKTTIAHTFAEWLENNHLLAASFFCTRTKDDCRKVDSIIPTIAHQLARYSIPFQSALCEGIIDMRDATSKSIAKQFEQLLKGPLLQEEAKLPAANHTKSNFRVVVIDALDECHDQALVGILLDVLCQQAASLPLKFFITSRPEQVVSQTMFQNSQYVQAIHLHNIEESLVQADIELYLREEFSLMSFDRHPADSDIKQLAEQSGKLFIYAATLVRHIKPIDEWSKPHETLRSLLDMTSGKTAGHEQLDELYLTVLNSALNRGQVKKDGYEDIRSVLFMVLYAREPISLEAIAGLCAINEQSRVVAALRPLRSVLYRSDATGLVSTLHASFLDFMFDSKRSGSYCGDTVEYGQSLAMRCFAVMKEQLRFNICDLKSSFILDEKVQGIHDRIKENISPTLAYTCRYWASYLALGPRYQGLLEPLTDFLSERLLFWMEVLNLQRMATMGIDVLLNTKQWLMETDNVSSNLVLWLEDAINFVTSYAANSSSISTPHIYTSALALCPRSSLVYKHYSKRVRGLLELKGSVMERRDAAPQAHWNVGSIVLAVAYSPDGTRVAAGCEGGTVSIRSAVDGKSLVGPLKGHTKAVWSVTFSPDGKLLASGSWDNTIRVWNVLTGDLIAGPFEGHTGIVSSVSFSPDGKRIVSGAWDRTIRVWNATDGTLLLGPLEGHDDDVNSVSFSPDGSLIASASDDRTIRLWHSHDGSPASSPFQGHTQSVRSIVFTPDGTRLVSGSNDKTVRVWNVSDGSPIAHPFEGHTDAIRSVAVSTDGTRVASSSNDCTVRVWNIEDGSLVAGPLVGDNQQIVSVAFSPDDTRVIADSGSGIQVWNVREGVHAPILSALQDAVRSIESMKLSTDGSSILTCSRDKPIRMWDVRVGSFTEDRDQEPFESTSISDTSPDGTYVLGESEEGKVQIMHKAYGSLAAGPFDVGRRSLSAFRFSHDNSSVIMGCRDGTIQVQPLPGRKAPVSVFYGHQEDIRSIDQSHDGSFLVSYSDPRYPWGQQDISMRVWSMITPVLQLESFPNSLPTSAVNHSPPAVYDGWQVNKDGWVVNGNNQLLFWLPSDIAAIYPSPYASLIITKFGVLIVPEQKVFVGEQWWKCYVGDQSQSNDLTHTSPIRGRA